MDVDSVVKFDNVTYQAAQRKNLPGINNLLRNIFRPQIETITVLKGTSFELKPKQIIGFISTDAKEKELFLSILNGIVIPTSGTITIAGTTPKHKDSDFNKTIGIVSSHKSHLWKELSTQELFELQATLYNIPRSDLNAKANELAELLDIAKVLDTKIRKVSSLIKLKCEILIALLHSPQLLILEDIAANLTVAEMDEVGILIKQLSDKYELTVIYTVDNLDTYLPSVTQLLVLDQAEVVYKGSRSRFLAQFAIYKYLHVNYDHEIPTAKLARFGEVLEVNATHATVLIHRDAQERIVGELKNEIPDIQISLSEPSIATVIENIRQVRQDIMPAQTAPQPVVESQVSVSTEKVVVPQTISEPVTPPEPEVKLIETPTPAMTPVVEAAPQEATPINSTEI